MPGPSDLSDTVSRITARLSALESTVEERDRRYDKQFESIERAISLTAERNAVALGAAKEAVNSALAAADRAVEKAERASEKRFENVNEFRGQMSDMQTTFARSDLVDTRIVALDKKIQALDDKVNELFRRESGSTSRGTAYGQGFGWIATGIGIISAIAVAIAAIFLRGENQ